VKTPKDLALLIYHTPQVTKATMTQFKGREFAPILPSPFTYPNASIETPRLLLRPFLETDAEDFYANRSVPKVTQWS
jgi:hypothetical protein